MHPARRETRREARPHKNLVQHDKNPGPRAQVIGLQGPNTSNALVYGRKNPIIWVLGHSALNPKTPSLGSLDPRPLNPINPKPLNPEPHYLAPWTFKGAKGRRSCRALGQATRMKGAKGRPRPPKPKVLKRGFYRRILYGV